MSEITASTAEQFDAIVAAFSDRPEVMPPAGTGFGSGGLRVNGKIFAMVSSKGLFVVKLPRPRVDALVTAGEGDRYDPGHGRLMKEWLALKPASSLPWLPLAEEALTYVSSTRRS